jgi:hypothetical protein
VRLTTAHLDHQPENCDPSTLRAMCECCHLSYDRDHHAETAYIRRRAGKAAADLFIDETPPNRGSTMFRLTEQPAKLKNHNARNERHGEELKLAGDINLQVVCRATALDAFDMGFRPLLYRQRKDGDEPVQTTVEGNKEDAELARRLPQLEPLSWNEKFPGFTLTIVKGMGLAKPIVLPMRELSGFVFEAMDGGMVKITFRASGTYDTTAISGELDGLQQRDVEISLEPPAADAVAEVQGELLPKREPQNFNATVISTGMEDDERGVLVKAIEITLHAGRHLCQVACTLSDDEVVQAGEWASRPTLDEIANGLFDQLECPIEFTPAARDEYEAKAAA